VEHGTQVDHTGFSTLNSQRFGQKFVGRVANPHDMLAWHKAAVRRIKPGERGGEGGLRALPEPGARPEAMDEAEIETQVSRHLVQTLQVISEADLAVALHNYIDKVGSSVVSCQPSHLCLLKQAQQAGRLCLAAKQFPQYCATAVGLPHIMSGPHLTGNAQRAPSVWYMQTNLRTWTRPDTTVISTGSMRSADFCTKNFPSLWQQSKSIPGSCWGF